MIITIEDKIIIVEKKEDAVVALTQNFLLQNKSPDEFLQQVGITGKMLEVKQIIQMLSEIIG